PPEALEVALVDGIADIGAVKRSKSTRSSRTDWYRRSGSLSRHFRIRYSKPGDIFGLTEVGDSGSWLRIESISMGRLRSGKGRRPVAISYSTAPADQMSARVSLGSPRSCSGAM